MGSQDHKSAELYLELLKKTLAFALWPEPPSFATYSNSKRARWKAKLVTLIDDLVKRFGFRICSVYPISATERNEGRCWSRYADTLIGLKRLSNIQACVEQVLRDNVPGDLIEAGVWRGGACIFMRGVLKAYGITDRRIFVADSFQGLPAPQEKYIDDKGDRHHLESFLRVDAESVRANFRKYNLLDNQVLFLEGWFSETLPQAPVERLAILRLDSDMYGSTIESLETLYPKLSSGGFCIVDDYALSGCQRAVDEYRKRHAITQVLQEIDWTGRYWRK